MRKLIRYCHTKHETAFVSRQSNATRGMMVFCFTITTAYLRNQIFHSMTTRGDGLGCQTLLCTALSLPFQAEASPNHRLIGSPGSGENQGVKCGQQEAAGEQSKNGNTTSLTYAGIGSKSDHHLNLFPIVSNHSLGLLCEFDEIFTQLERKSQFFRLFVPEDRPKNQATLLLLHNQRDRIPTWPADPVPLFPSLDYFSTRPP